eukprot:COSAG05_NODE_35_length_27765_cov_221.324719_4_plen_68_part_00
MKQKNQKKKPDQDAKKEEEEKMEDVEQKTNGVATIEERTPRAVSHRVLPSTSRYQRAARCRVPALIW